MQVCMHVHMHISVYLHICIHLHIRTHLHICAHLHICVHVRVCVCTLCSPTDRGSTVGKLSHASLPPAAPGLALINLTVLVLGSDT